MINIGDCFTLHTHGKPHLHIVVQDQRPGDINSQVICVYLCSVGTKTIIDDRTILEKGQHTFITEKSFIKYNNVLVESKCDIEPKILDRYEQIDNGILNHIQSQFLGQYSYKKIPNGIKLLFNQWHEDNIFNRDDF